MCLKKGCVYIEIIEIRDGVKVILHYDNKGIPIFIQYLDDNTRTTKEFH